MLVSCRHGANEALPSRGSSCRHSRVGAVNSTMRHCKHPKSELRALTRRAVSRQQPRRASNSTDRRYKHSAPQSSTEGAMHFAPAQRHSRDIGAARRRSHGGFSVVSRRRGDQPAQDGGRGSALGHATIQRSHDNERLSLGGRACPHHPRRAAPFEGRCQQVGTRPPCPNPPKLVQNNMSF